MYRIITEDVNKGDTILLVQKYFPKGFTTLQAIGYWGLQREASIVFEIETNETAQKVLNLAAEIKTLNKQESVLVQEVYGLHWFVGEQPDRSIP